MKLLTKSLKNPNGLVGSQEDSILYITDHGDNKTWSFNIINGNLTDKTLFVELGGDGMTLDEKGNVYITNLTNSSVDVFTKDGALVQQIKVPETPSNVAFAAKTRMNYL